MSLTDVIVLDGNDVPSPEDTAMLQALYSRSPKSVREHLKAVEARGSSSFMQQYLVQYGHKSIGDCGTTTIFIENVSLLAAKAIQDWPLYNGQEVSTRYLDMTERYCYDPSGTEAGKALLKKSMDFYTEILPELVDHIRKENPIKDAENEVVYNKAIKARAFDIARGFLPAGVTSSLSWHTNLRQASDHLKQLRHHPLAEVRDIAHAVVDALKAKYPSSFSHKQHDQEEEYLYKMAELDYNMYKPAEDQPDFWAGSHLNQYFLEDEAVQTALRGRPAKAELPNKIRLAGDVSFEFLLDFGSFRDLQRHRSCVQSMPIHLPCDGFHPWYLEQLPDSLKERAELFLCEFVRDYNALARRERLKVCDCQYFVPMGYLCWVSMRCSLPAAVYLAELRSTQYVHPTLRARARQIGDWLEANVEGLVMHHDRSPDEWTSKRGEQDIVERK